MFEKHESMDFEFEPVSSNPSYQNVHQEPQFQSQMPSGSPIPPKKNSKFGLKIVALALVCALLGGVGGGTLVAGLLNSNGSDAEDTSESTPVMNTTDTTQDTSTTLSTVVHTNTGDKNLTPTEVYNQNVNAVVGISTEATTTNVFGQVSSAICSGSGFIITSDGYVVTNNHVVEDADKVTVSMYDGSTYDAKIVGTEPSNDVALLKIEGSNFPTVSIGSSDDVSVGDQVVAIGNPLGELTFTLTVGYVSALDREINTDGNPINMLQTDVSINSGNSGGPLFDMNGNVIGITTAKYSSSSLSSASIEGIGFAIPINDVMSIVDDLEKYGYVTGKPQLGVTVRDFDTTTAATYGLPAGVYVQDVEAGSAAEKGGIQSGDIITGMNGKEVANYTEMAVVMKQLKAGQTVEITVFRGGQTLTLTVTLDEKAPATEESASTENQTTSDAQDQQPSQGQTQDPQQSEDPFRDIFGSDGFFSIG